MRSLKTATLFCLVMPGLFNVTSGALLPADVPLIECEALYNLSGSKGGPIVVDVRAPEDFRDVHIAGAISVPFYKLPKAASWPKQTQLVLYCEGKGCPLSRDSALVLMKAGYTNVKVLNGGIREWRLKEYPLAADKIEEKKTEIREDTIFKGGTVTAKQLYEQFASTISVGGKISGGNVAILDLRSENEYKAAHLPGSKNVPFEKLQEAIKTLPEQIEVIVCDKTADRSGQAVQILNQSRFPAHSLLGGIIVWASAGYPLMAGTDHEK